MKVVASSDPRTHWLHDTVGAAGGVDGFSLAGPIGAGVSAGRAAQ